MCALARLYHFARARGSLKTGSWNLGDDWRSIKWEHLRRSSIKRAKDCDLWGIISLWAVQLFAADLGVWVGTSSSRYCIGSFFFLISYWG